MARHSLVTLGCAALLLSCVSRDTTKLSNLSEGCLLNSDCAAPLACVFRRCHQPCATERDCPANAECQLAGDPPQLVCNLASCADGQRCPQSQVCGGADDQCRARCEVTADCAEGQLCLSGQCVWRSKLAPDGGFPAPRGSCRLTSDCPLDAGEFQVCTNGRCSRQCAQDRDCPVAGERCAAEGRCVGGPSGVACVLNSDCGADGGSPLVCLAGSCGPECKSPRDCGGRACLLPQGACAPQGSLATACRLSSECAEGLRCVAGFCGEECRTDRDCVAGGVGFVCQQGACVSPPDAGVAECRYTSDCPVGKRCDAQRCVRECVADNECAAGFSCLLPDGRCVVAAVDAGSGLTRCAYTSQCGVGEKCSPAGLCVPECLQTVDCPPGFVCSALRACVQAVPGDAGSADAGARCTYTSQCAAGLKCSAQGTCIPECLDSRDCAAGFMCQAQRCVALDAGPECTFSSQCLAGQRCSAQGRCVPECLDSRDCAAGLSCVADRCVAPDAGLACAFNSQCVLGQRCSAQGRCVPECQDSRDCPNGYACTAERCLAADAGQSCLLNSQCLVGQRCVAGACTVECLTSVDCALGSVCVASRCLPPVPGGDGGVPAGWGTPCAVDSTCAPFNLVCGPTGVCVYQCAEDRDCLTGQGQCCRQNRCAAASACYVPPADGGAPDAGRDGGVPVGGACRADVDCLDNDFCNGAEACRAGRCVAGTNPCFDDNPCSLDICDNGLRTCSYQTQAIDSDGDGRYPTTCTGAGADGGPGDDCDDGDPTVFPGAPERCDWKDNNCNGLMDELLWHERPGARGAVTSSGAYTMYGGPPHAARVGDSVIAAVPSHAVLGRLDAFRLSVPDFSLVSGPVTLRQSTTSWSLCGSVNGKAVMRPQLFTNGTQVAMTGALVSYASPQASCCSAETRRYEAAFVLADETLAQVTPAPLTQVVDTGSLAACRELVDLPGGNSRSSRLDRAGAAYSAHLGQWIATWWDDGVPLGSPTLLRFATVTPDGGVGAPRPVYPLSPNEAAYSDLSQSNAWRLTAPRVAVGTRSVLFAWTNDRIQPYPGDWTIRYVLYDADLTSPRGTPGMINPSLGGVHRVDDITFDGTNYELVISSTNPNQYGARHLILDEDGVVVRAPRAVGQVWVNPSPGAGNNTQVGVAYLGARGLVTATSFQNWLRVWYTTTVGDAGVGVVDVDLGVPAGSHSDFTAVPLSDRAVGILWSDGDLKRTVVECGP